MVNGVIKMSIRMFKIAFTTNRLIGTGLLLFIGLIFVFVVGITGCKNKADAPATVQNTKAVEEEIWKLEEFYFTKMFDAQHDSALTVAHDKYLAWTDVNPEPSNKQETLTFLKKLLPAPSGIKVSLEHKGISLTDNAALTQMIRTVVIPDTVNHTDKTIRTRITHTWVKDGGKWKMLGGMSFDLHNEVVNNYKN